MYLISMLNKLGTS